jgi:PKD repeat protein
MKPILTAVMALCFFSVSCKKHIFITPAASFSFRGDTSLVLKMGTYDTCSLQNNSTNSDSTFWDFGNGDVSKENSVILTYSKAGTYTVKLTAKNRDGQEASITKTVIVLDRVLKRIIIKSVYWDTIPNSIPNFNSVWPTSSTADVFVLIQKFSWTDSIVPYSGIMPNSPILYQSPLIPNVSSKTTNAIQIDVLNRFVVDKKMVLDRSFAISLMAKDKTGVVYALETSLASGSSFGIQQESFANNKFVMVCYLLSSLEFHCEFE